MGKRREKPTVAACSRLLGVERSLRGVEYRLSTYEGKDGGSNSALKAKTNRQRASFIHSMSDCKLIIYIGYHKENGRKLPKADNKGAGC